MPRQSTRFVGDESHVAGMAALAVYGLLHRGDSLHGMATEETIRLWDQILDEAEKTRQRLPVHRPPGARIYAVRPRFSPDRRRDNEVSFNWSRIRTAGRTHL